GNLWDNKQNWLDETDPQNVRRADHYPGQQGMAGIDIAEFNDTDTSNCGVHVPVTIGALVIRDGYKTVPGATPGDQNVKGTIFLNQTITVTGFTVNGQPYAQRLQGGTIDVGNWQDSNDPNHVVHGGGQLIYDGPDNSVFWGRLATLDYPDGGGTVFGYTRIT